MSASSSASISTSNRSACDRFRNFVGDTRRVDDSSYVVLVVVMVQVVLGVDGERRGRGRTFLTTRGELGFRDDCGDVCPTDGPA
jgi:hypothetical protein